MNEFAGLLLLGPNDESIIVQTRKGNSVKNAIDPSPRKDQIDKYRRLLEKHPNWVERVPAIGGYNCVGHVWASRRTGIFEQEQIDIVFRDDGFRIVDETKELIHPGDLVAYWSTDHQHFLHIGLVVELRSAVGFTTSIPWVLSKMDATSGEVLHHFRDIDFPGFEYRFEFWTERQKLLR